MNGFVDEFGRALVTVSLLPTEKATVEEIPAWIDTGFNGDLVLSQTQIDALSLQPSGTLKAILADGSEVSLERFICLIDWFGEIREMEVVANEGEVPLLGIGLLLGHDLRINYVTGDVTID